MDKLNEDASASALSVLGIIRRDLASPETVVGKAEWDLSEDLKIGGPKGFNIFLRDECTKQARS